MISSFPVHVDMHVPLLCMFLCVAHHMCMTVIDTPGIGIGEEQLSNSAPLVRALVVQRLELMWRTCEPFINAEAGKPDPRFIEAGIRVVDRLTRLYRLDSPVHGANEPDTGTRTDTRELVRLQVGELEARMGGDSA